MSFSTLGNDLGDEFMQAYEETKPLFEILNGPHAQDLRDKDRHRRYCKQMNTLLSLQRMYNWTYLDITVHSGYKYRFS